MEIPYATTENMEYHAKSINYHGKRRLLCKSHRLQQKRYNTMQKL